MFIRRSLHLILAAVFSMAVTSCSTARKVRRTPIAPTGITREFAEQLGRKMRAPLLEGNEIRELVNGNEIFPAMLASIHAATNSINFENFIWRSGVLSDHFIAALSDKARSGVEVRILIDAFGSLGLDNADEAKLREAGVQFVKYNSLWKIWRWNHRTHRKLMIVDGSVGFIGGACIGDAWMGDAEHEPIWRDTHYRLEGPVVVQMQRVFLINWREATREVLASPEFFPVLTNAGASAAHCFASGPKEGSNNARRTYLHSIHAATNSIRLAHSYFVPDRASIRALVAARRRGVHVEIITPGRIHANVVRRASRSRWERLIKAGVEFYEFDPTAYHCKLMIVDDVWVSIGSINFDERSFRINDEANVNVLDPEFAARQIAVFDRDKQKSFRVTLESYNRRSIWIKFVENFYGLFRSVL